MSEPQLQETFPFINDVEKDILPALMQDRHMWVTFSNAIEPHYFNSIDRQKLFRILFSFFKKYKAYPTEEQTKDMLTRSKLVHKEMIIEVEYLFRRPRFSLEEVKYLKDEMSVFIKENKIKTAIVESMDILEKTEKDYFSIETKIKEAVNWDSNVNLGVEIRDVERRFQMMDELQQGALPAPWMAYNRIAGGGFYAKELVIFIASSSVGKSIALDNVAAFGWLTGKNIVSITCELSEERKISRVDASLLDMSTIQLFQNRDRIGEFYYNRERDNRFFIKEFPTGKCTADHIDQYLYQLETYEGLKEIDYLIIDYVDIMAPAKRTGDAYTDQGAISENLRAIAMERKTRVISASQLNRGAALNQIPIEDINEGLIADSWKKICTADTIAALVASAEDRKQGKLNVKMLKNRNGEKDVIFPLRAHYEYLKFTDINPHDIEVTRQMALKPTK